MFGTKPILNKNILGISEVFYKEESEHIEEMKKLQYTFHQIESVVSEDKLKEIDQTFVRASAWFQES